MLFRRSGPLINIKDQAKGTQHTRDRTGIMVLGIIRLNSFSSPGCASVY